MDSNEEIDDVDLDKVKDRIQKILALAAGSSHEGEIFNATALASRLAAKYNIDAADIKDKNDAERVIEQVTSTEVRQGWARYVWQAVSNLNFCYYYYTSVSRYPDVHNVIGTKANVIATKMMALYLVDTVERLAREAPIEKRERPAFKLGAAARLSTRLSELKKMRAAGSEQPAPTEVKLPALANLYKVHEKENEEFYLNLSGGQKLGKGQHSNTKNGKAFMVGVKAANDISLSGQVDKTNNKMLS